MPDGIIGELLNCSDNVSATGHWITPIIEALDGISATDAAWKPSDKERSIWEIVNHVISWTDWVVTWLTGTDTEVLDWPPVTDTSPAAWDAARERLTASLNAFRDQIAATDPARLFEAPTPEATSTVRYRGITSILVHIAYHAGQITKMRERAQ